MCFATNCCTSIGISAGIVFKIRKASFPCQTRESKAGNNFGGSRRFKLVFVEQQLIIKIAMKRETKTGKGKTRSRKTAKITVVIPVLNESRTIADVVKFALQNRLVGE